MENDRGGASAVKRAVRICIIAALACLGTAFLLYGIFSGGISSVFIKAAHICLECIGIG